MEREIIVAKIQKHKIFEFQITDIEKLKLLKNRFNKTPGNGNASQTLKLQTVGDFPGADIM